MKLKNQAILEIFYVKELNNLIGRDNSGGKTQEPVWKNLKWSNQLANSIDTYQYAKKSTS